MKRYHPRVFFPYANSGLMVGIKKYFKYFFHTMNYYGELNKEIGGYCDDDQNLAIVSLLLNSQYAGFDTGNLMFLSGHASKEEDFTFKVPFNLFF